MMLREESRGWQASPADHHRSESQLGIPQRVALQRSSSPLPQPSRFSRERLKASTIDQRTVVFNTADCFTFGVHRKLFIFIGSGREDISSDHLNDEALKVMSFGNGQKDRVVLRLSTPFEHT